VDAHTERATDIGQLVKPELVKVKVATWPFDLDSKEATLWEDPQEIRHTLERLIVPVDPLLSVPRSLSLIAPDVEASEGEVLDHGALDILFERDPGISLKRWHHQSFR
jgi:hypothetical protein